MPEVTQKVLNWLHSVLIGEYQDITRTYTDVARTLAEFGDLHPSTEVYTFENGHSSLLVHLTGTLPVKFRSSIYAFPVSIWITQSYPIEAPIAFATPTRDMVIRPGQHVSGEGRIYHPYLASWRPDRCSITDLVHMLQDIFSREPPVIARRDPGESMLRPTNGHIPPPRPPLPPELSRSSSVSQSTQARMTTSPRPPPPPPKSFTDQRTFQKEFNGGPPVPPQPPIPAKQLNSNTTPLHRSLLPTNYGPPSVGRYPMNRPVEFQSPSFTPTNHRRSPSAAYEQQRREDSQSTQSLPQLGQAFGKGPQYHSLNRLSSPGFRTPMNADHHQPYPETVAGQPGTTQLPHQISAIPPRSQSMIKQQPDDLLTSPFDPPLPTQSSESIPAPPIPPNPEKDALLSALSRTLTNQLQLSVASNSAAIQPLSAQHNAMTNALHNLQREQATLTSLQSLLSSNEAILHKAMRDADGCITSAQHRSVPGVDEVLVAPTVVGQQLYDLVADEKACAETREVLGRALDRGRLSSEVWVKKVRELAREEFMKKVLVRKCAEGMGLRIGEDWS